MAQRRGCSTGSRVRRFLRNRRPAFWTIPVAGAKVVTALAAMAGEPPAWIGMPADEKPEMAGEKRELDDRQHPREDSNALPDAPQTQQDHGADPDELEQQVEHVVEGAAFAAGHD